MHFDFFFLMLGSARIYLMDIKRLRLRLAQSFWCFCKPIEITKVPLGLLHHQLIDW